LKNNLMKLPVPQNAHSGQPFTAPDAHLADWSSMTEMIGPPESRSSSGRWLVRPRTSEHRQPSAFLLRLRIYVSPPIPGHPELGA
jgi:hypothetical protein